MIENFAEELNGQSFFDGDYLTQWKIEQGHLVRKVTQPNEDRLLAGLSELRKNADALRPLSFMGVELMIPKGALRGLWKKYPALNSTDANEKNEAWLKFFASSEADPYRVRPRQVVRGL